MDVPGTLLVTNDFPPRVGGIQRMLGALVAELPADRITVMAPNWEGAATSDAGKPYRIHRAASEFMWPSPALGRRILEVAGESDADVVVFGAASPLALLGPQIAAAGIPYIVIAHGFEYWLSLLPGSHALMRRATSRASRVTACSEFVGRTVRTAVPEAVPVSVLPPGADTQRFRPDLPTEELRSRYAIADRPVVVCVSRLVARKGQDVLIRAMSEIRRHAPEAVLVIVGAGPYEASLRQMAARAPGGSVIFTGEVPDAELPLHYALGDVFAMPCRTRLGGLEVEGWGAVFIEAAACGKPVVVGNSGGAREALLDGVTGVLVDGRDVGSVGRAVGRLLSDGALARQMGAAGRARVERELSWPGLADRLGGWLRTAAG